MMAVIPIFCLLQPHDIILELSQNIAGSHKMASFNELI